ncbi:MAG: hypothetical protein DHS20C19_15470 [Acidimicrobiales bacterium]|nr:MAG: hypothetical protein DHS20C19_15470 [Acidimicrobiales bacterium]
MSRLARVKSVEHLGGRVLRLTFTDDIVRELDFRDALPGILAAVDTDEEFSSAKVDPVAGTLSWPCGIDLDPDVLRGRSTAATAIQPRVLAEYRLQQTS